MTTRPSTVALSTVALSTAILAATALGVGGAATASDVPFYVAGGISLFSGDLRDLTDQRGYTAALGWGDKQRSLIGAPSLDLTWGHVQGNGNKFDSVSVMYSERVPLADAVYVGAGVGSFWNQLDVQGDKDSDWTIGARGSAGVSLGGFSSFSPFVELTWFYPLEKTHGVQTDYVAIVGGFWF
jgi:hypothetical protein